ncbi:hypothetical protein ACFY7C_08640 [Streptomyces sp. NPDC012769]|uniref:hypothetical protein n=1 Tax=Streptomyces sp. NPDC012769 TaxID=3364848 RepID=UPI00367BCCC6
MGTWAVIAQYGSGENYRTRVVGEVTGTREQAREALWKAAQTFREPVREKRRRVYRLGDGDSCLVRVNGMMSETYSVLSLAELVHDSADPSAGAAELFTEAAGPFGPAADASAGAAAPEDAPPAQ